jgi:hypothetical protein
MIPIGLELAPDFLISAAVASQPADAAGALCRIERGEVNQLHGKACGGPTQKLSDRHDFGISSVHLTEWQSEIQAARDHQLIVRPRYPCLGAHAVLQTQSLTLGRTAQLRPRQSWAEVSGGHQEPKLRPPHTGERLARRPTYNDVDRVVNGGFRFELSDKFVRFDLGDVLRKSFRLDILKRAVEVEPMRCRGKRINLKSTYDVKTGTMESKGKATAPGKQIKNSRASAVHNAPDLLQSHITTHRQFPLFRYGSPTSRRAVLPPTLRIASSFPPEAQVR